MRTPRADTTTKSSPTGRVLTLCEVTAGSALTCRVLEKKESKRAVYSPTGRDSILNSPTFFSVKISVPHHSNSQAVSPVLIWTVDIPTVTTVLFLPHPPYSPSTMDENSIPLIARPALLSASTRLKFCLISTTRV